MDCSGISTEEIVDLNVGGENFSTTVGTLTKYPESMLGAMFSGRFGLPKRDARGRVFIDRDPNDFRAVLRYLRSGTIVPECNSELEYFGLLVRSNAADVPGKCPSNAPDRI